MTLFFENVERAVSDSKSEALSVAAGKSFLETMHKHSFNEVSKDTLAIWIVEMALAGLKVNTRKKYFSRIHTMWQAFKTDACENPFDAVRNKLDVDIWCYNEKFSRNLCCLESLVNVAGDVPDREYIDIFLYLLYNPSATIRDIIDLRFTNLSEECPQVDDLIDKQKELSKRMRNVFGLGQGKKREPQIESETLLHLKDVAKRAGIDFGENFSRESITALWIAAAIKVGISAVDIRSTTPTVPAEYSTFANIPILPIGEQSKKDIINKVADYINGNPKQWFVMKMRPGQTPVTIRRKIESTLDGFLAEMMFYYPMRKTFRITPGGKKIRRDVPYLPGILFFKIGRKKVPVLMSRIGDVAWCYKYSISKESRYCAISLGEMRAFQNHIGQFTPDIRMELVTRDEPMKIGSEVIINGGGRMEGHIGRITSVKNSDGARTYTLMLSEKECAQWTVKDVAEIFIEPVKNVRKSAIAETD